VWTEVARLVRIDTAGNTSNATLGRGDAESGYRSALVRSPAIYLMDEHVSSLPDAKVRTNARRAEAYSGRFGACNVLYCGGGGGTHDQIEAITMASRIGILRAGAPLQGGTRRKSRGPANIYVQHGTGIREINFLTIDA